jgi:hypothetical protein
VSIGKLFVLTVALVLVSGGFGAALADWSSPEPGPAIDLVDADARKDEGTGDGVLVTEEETDEDEPADGPPAATAPQGSPAPLSPPLSSGPGAGGGEVTADNEARPRGTGARPLPALPAPAGPAADAADDDVAGGAGGGAGGDDDGGGDTD